MTEKHHLAEVQQATIRALVTARVKIAQETQRQIGEIGESLDYLADLFAKEKGLEGEYVFLQNGDSFTLVPKPEEGEPTSDET